MSQDRIEELKKAVKKGAMTVDDLIFIIDASADKLDILTARVKELERLEDESI